ncbi:hypothetical protein JOS77_13580 [Chromobacterium haemolyticum]|nr:hypothetical protein JOS77_13580 [Chromobacterium haemolyticum]
MSANTIVSPICVKEPLRANLTLPWFLQTSEYAPHEGSFQPLVNGEAAFAAVHYAIAKAKKNVSIICWGFQPSMYFVRKGADMVKYADIAEAVPAQIGKLLEHKAKQGVQVRVLCFASKPAGLYVNSTGATVGESQTPGRWKVGLKDKPDYETPEQYKYDSQWYSWYDEDQPAAGATDKIVRDRFHKDIPSKHLHFRSRGFGTRARAHIAAQDYDDKGLKKRTKTTLAGAPSHHQKMVLVDYDDAQAHVGFVMGHNMLDEYWDTNAHSAKPKAPNLGRNGTVGPREDFSSLITGPAVGDLFHNFRRAWRDETKEDLPLPGCGFGSYAPRVDGQANKAAMVQLLRTQPEYKKTGHQEAVSEGGQQRHFLHLHRKPVFPLAAAGGKDQGCGQGAEAGRPPLPYLSVRDHQYQRRRRGRRHGQHLPDAGEPGARRYDSRRGASGKGG